MRNLTSVLTLMLLTSVVSMGPTSQAHALLNPGNILVIGTDSDGEGGLLFRVDPATGTRTVVSDFNDSAQGELTHYFPVEVAIDAAGKILVTGIHFTEKSLLFRVDPATGFRTVVSNFEDSTQGALGKAPADVAVDVFNILVVDQEQAGPGECPGALFSIDPATGFRNIISRCIVDGPVGFFDSVAVDSAGNIWVLDPGVQLRGSPRFSPILFRVDPTIHDALNLCASRIGSEWPLPPND